MRHGFVALRQEAGVPDAFAADVQAEADVAAQRPDGAERIDLPFVTIDPPGARDLDQALHVALARGNPPTRRRVRAAG